MVPEVKTRTNAEAVQVSTFKAKHFHGEKGKKRKKKERDRRCTIKWSSTRLRHGNQLDVKTKHGPRIRIRGVYVVQLTRSRQHSHRAQVCFPPDNIIIISSSL